MVQLSILSGKQAGAVQVARRLPFRIGRAGADLTLEEAGVWEQHAEIRADPDRRIFLHVRPEAFASVNASRVQHAALRAGDLVEIGSVQLRFGFAPVRSRSLGWREALVWIGLSAICLAQIGVIYWLLE